jgi:hypothetical protein
MGIGFERQPSAADPKRRRNDGPAPQVWVGNPQGGAMPTRSKDRRWSAKVTETSNAMDLEPKVFEQKDPGRIAASLKHSAEQSKRRKSSPFQSAMSMLTFYMNRAGKSLPAERKETLQKAKDELRKDFGRE